MCRPSNTFAQTRTHRCRLVVHVRYKSTDKSASFNRWVQGKSEAHLSGLRLVALAPTSTERLTAVAEVCSDGTPPASPRLAFRALTEPPKDAPPSNRSAFARNTSGGGGGLKMLSMSSKWYMRAGALVWISGFLHGGGSGLTWEKHSSESGPLCR